MLTRYHSQTILKSLISNRIGRTKYSKFRSNICPWHVRNQHTFNASANLPTSDIILSPLIMQYSVFYTHPGQRKKMFMFRIQGSILVIYWNTKLFIQLSKSILAWRLKWDLVIKSCDFFWNNVITRWLYKIHFVQVVMIVQKYHTAKQLQVLYFLWNWILSTCLDHSWLLFLFDVPNHYFWLLCFIFDLIHWQAKIAYDFIEILNLAFILLTALTNK